MKDKERTKEELIIELHKLQQENTAFKSSFADYIKEQEEKEDICKESLYNWRSAFDAIDDIVLLLSPSHEIIGVNQAGLIAFGKPREEVLGKKCYHLAHNTDAPIPECPCHIALNEKRSSITEYTLDNKTYELSAWPILDEKNEIKAFTHIVKDITKRKQTETALLQAKKDWEDVFDSVTDAITIHDSEYNIIRSNKAGQALLKLPEMEKQINMKCFSFFHGTNAPPVNCPSCNCWKSGLPGVFELFEPNLNREIEIRAIPIIDSSNKIAGLIHIVRDISERKLNEKELIKAKERAEESDRLKSAFLANMSHEIRTPMNGILGFAGLLKEPGLTGEEQQAYINIIEKSGARMLNIINDIVSISKIESGTMNIKVSDVNINEQIEFVYLQMSLGAEEKKLNLTFHKSLTDKDSIVRTDKDKIDEILTNLVSNAIKYTDKGSISFGYIVKTDPLAVEPTVLEFYIKDTGIGIPEDKKTAIFERFIQADISDPMARHGAGLGLSISKAYVEMLGGKIWVESEVGEGSTFYFTLPFSLSR